MKRLNLFIHCLSCRNRSVLRVQRCYYMYNSYYNQENCKKIKEWKMYVGNKGMCRKFTVAVEGNIGSGKTSLLQYFSKFPDALILQEPVNNWRNVEGFNLLDLMYRDPQKWSFTFQSYVQLTMVQQHSKKCKQNERVKLMERSIYSARYCFVENLFRSGRLSQANCVVLSKWFNFLIENTSMHLDLIVYLQTKPETVFKRICERSREEEKNISLEYLRDLHFLHEDWLIHQRSFQVPCPVLVLDANCSFDEMEKLFKKHEDELLFSNMVDQTANMFQS